jgi:hypothetical protein
MMSAVRSRHRLPAHSNINVRVFAYRELAEACSLHGLDRGRQMLIIQTDSARQFRKYTIAFAIVFVLTGGIFPMLTMHWYGAPPKK